MQLFDLVVQLLADHTHCVANRWYDAALHLDGKIGVPPIIPPCLALDGVARSRCALAVINTELFSLTFLLSMFVPWQGSYVSTLRRADAREDDSPTRNHYLFWLAGSAVLALSLTPSAIRMPLNELVGPPPPPITLNVLTATSVPTKTKERHVTVRYQIIKNIPGSASCGVELKSDGTTSGGPPSEGRVNSKNEADEAAPKRSFGEL